MDAGKQEFLKQQVPVLVHQLQAQSQPLWGKMTAQHMLEHLAAFFQLSFQTEPLDLLTPEAHLPKVQEFLRSEKPFRENTKAPLELVPENPPALQYNSFEAARKAAIDSCASFFRYYTAHPDAAHIHPVFGQLDYADWVLLHYKHVSHHFRQFGLMG